jgi:hypothetical protein
MAASLCLLLGGGLVHGAGFSQPAPLPPGPDSTLYFNKPAASAPGPVPLPLPEPAPVPSQGPELLPPVQAQPLSLPLPEPRPVPSPAEVRPVLLQQPAPLGPIEEGTEYQIQLAPPSRDRLFRVESEASLETRLRQEAISRGSTERLEFPEENPLSTEKYVARSWAQSDMIVEPNYVCYGRLFFEDKNSERYGWDLGFIQPFVSAGLFYADLALLPYHCGTDPCRKCECSAGYCLPGDPVPYLCYPPDLSVTGVFAEAAAIGTLFAIFP